MRPFDFFIYGVVVFGWSTSWLPLKWQLGIVEPEVSLCWRFLLAAPIMFCLARIAGQKLSFNWSEHLRFSALGLCIFSVNFTLFYHAGKRWPQACSLSRSL